MSNPSQPGQNPAHDQELEDDDPQLEDEDIVEVHEDEGDGDQPMDEDDDDDDNEKYDGEIVIGAPMPGEEEALADMEQMYEDNTLGSTCRSKSGPDPHPPVS